MRRSGFLILFIASLFSVNAAAEEIRFLEDFSLAENRAAALEQLIPGTESYYYFHALHYQNTQQFEKVDALLTDWVKWFGESAQVQEIKHRQALLTYSDSPEKSLAYIKTILGLRFNHQRELLDKELKLPSKLDPKTIQRSTLQAAALSRYRNLQGFEDSALFWLPSEKLTDEQRRHLLQRLQLPDAPDLVSLIAADLKTQHSGGFGSMTIHKQLTVQQLEDLLAKEPALKTQRAFVETYLRKLAPSADINWQRNRKEQLAYLNRLWDFSESLPATFSQLKSQIVYHMLALQMAQGKYDVELFTTYLKLPKRAVYVEPKYLQLEENRRHIADLGSVYSDAIMLPPVGNDEPLIREFLMHVFVEAADWKGYTAWVDDTYLKHLFAETKILNGLGDEEEWSSLLPPEKFQQLKERVDISFARTNPEHFEIGDDVRLDLVLKNTPKLLVKVYEINTETYYRQNLREVDTDIELDGLTANSEETIDIDLSPLRVLHRQFAFPQIKKPGVYVIDFLANGRSSRALVRIGELRFTVDSTAAGHLFRIYNGAGEHLPKASLWLSGHEYHANKKGEIRTPYSTNPGRQAVVITHQSQASLGFFQHAPESYRLDVGFYVDRENLLSRQRATLLIRPGLFLQDTPIGLSILEDVELTIMSTTIDDVQSTQVVKNLELFEDGETKHEFRTPARLRTIRFDLKATAKNISTGKDVSLSASRQFELNGIDTTDKTEDLHLAKFGDSYVIELLGKSGEMLPNRAVHITLKHRDFTNTVNATLQTDHNGRVTLGALSEIESVSASSPQGVSENWHLVQDLHTHRQVIQAAVGETIAVPLMEVGDKLTRADVALFEMRAGVFATDRFDDLTFKKGLLKISDLPRGDYALTLKQANKTITLRIAAGKRDGDFVVGESRDLEVRGENPLQIVGATPNKENVRIQLTNVNPLTRVHVFATRYEPAYSPFGSLSAVRDAESIWRKPAFQRTAYVAGRNIGEEYQYILNRRLQPKFVGVMLARPEFLLNPWAIRTTQTTNQLAELGDSFGGEGTGYGGFGGRPGADASDDRSLSSNAGFSSLDFLAQTSPTFANLKPNKAGVVEVPRGLLSGRQRIHIVAIDAENTAYRSISLDEAETDFIDLRLASALDPKLHYIQQNQVTIVPKGDKIVFRDSATSQFETYDSLDDVYRLYLGLTEDANLAKFGFVMKWPTLTEDEQRENYSKYACHELNFFLSQKDPKFYKDVVQPYMQNKYHKTYLDHWILGDDLAAYRQPWRHSRLNTVEQILLGKRIGAEEPFMQRLISDRLALLPPQSGIRGRLFDVAVLTSSLDADDLYGLDALIEEVAEEKAKDWSETRRRKSETYAKEMNRSADRESKPGNAAPSAPPKPSVRPAEESDEKAVADKKGRALNKLAEQQKQLGQESKFDDERLNRDQLKRFYVELDSTKEWVENNYYELPIEQQLAGLVDVNRFWNAYAEHPNEQPFLSKHLAEATGNFTEMMFALSVLDLPFEAADPKSEFKGPQLTIQSPGPMVVFHKEIQPAEKVAEESPILVTERFFKQGDRHRYENGQQVDKFVTGEFLIHQVYGCQVVLTNPTSTAQKLDLLLQIPAGSVPVMSTKATRNLHMDLQPFHTQTVEYHFYFPLAGDFAHYPVNVSRDDEVLAFAESRLLTVVDKPSQIDTTTWAYVSQYAENDDVFEYLQENNLQRLDLTKIAFRMKDKAFYNSVISLLDQRHAYNDTLWSYAIMHDELGAAGEYLQHANQFVSAVGMTIESPLLNIDPVLRHTYQHREYKPLVNARSHQLGRRRQILNDRLHWQYHEFLKVASYKPKLADEELAAAAYYLLLQDRVAEGIEFYEKINPKNLNEQLQFDYLTAYISFYREDLAAAEAIAKKYENHPVDRWREAFAHVGATIREINGAKIEVVNDDDQTQKNTQLAGSTPAFDFTLEGKSIKLNHQNLEQIEVRYYLMDIELLFSRNPFVKRFDHQAAYIRPNLVEVVKLPKKEGAINVELPKSLVSQNVLIEIVGAGETRTEPYFSNSLTVQMIENYGQLRVTAAGKPLPKAYVKTYARMNDGSVVFYKDGYTDLRGRFDYSTLSTNELSKVSQFSVLVLDEENGAVVREARPPKR